MEVLVESKLTFIGGAADSHVIDAYELSFALRGLQRVQLLSYAYLKTGKIYTKSNAIKDARCFVRPPKAGSWESIVALIGSIPVGTLEIGTLAAGLGFAFTQPRTNPLGNMVGSLMQFVVKKASGVSLNEEETMFEAFERAKRDRIIASSVTAARTDSLIEKCEGSVREMHLPIVGFSGATQVIVSSELGDYTLDRETYDFLSVETTDISTFKYEGKSAGFLSNTGNGRFYSEEFERAVPAKLVDLKKADSRLLTLISSQYDDVANSRAGGADIWIEAFPVRTPLGRIKRLEIVSVGRIV